MKEIRNLIPKSINPRTSAESAIPTIMPTVSFRVESLSGQITLVSSPYTSVKYLYDDLLFKI